jgi:Family of unknown function (DUF6194)
MNDVEISRHIAETFTGVDVIEASGDSFFIYNPEHSQPPDYNLMFATLVTSDSNDTFSNLDRPLVFRLNIGISKQTLRSRFGLPPRPDSSDDAAEEGEARGNYDFTVLDQIMPHPVYGRMYWVCVLNPSDETFEQNVKPLLADAYDAAVSKYTKLAARK